MSDYSIHRVTRFINMFPPSIVLLFFEQQKQTPMMGMLVPIITVVIASCHSPLGRPVIWNVKGLWQHCTTLVTMIYFPNWQHCCIPADWANITFASGVFCSLLSFFACFHQMRRIRSHEMSNFQLQNNTWQSGPDSDAAVRYKIAGGTESSC